MTSWWGVVRSPVWAWAMLRTPDEGEDRGEEQAGSSVGTVSVRHIRHTRRRKNEPPRGDSKDDTGFS